MLPLPTWRGLGGAVPGASPCTLPYSLTGEGASQSIELHLSYPHQGGEARVQLLLAPQGREGKYGPNCLGRWSPRLGSLHGL